ncbi:hypothetical protein IQ241_20170 [Romeria aff. gracilis LEGE 07310]|uniref:Uncharacterized protein n=1 Tax=Vasconcelosia minhoensis LEGE 07310 TaxID=915328 RepID=A0A8J7AUE2_9CYAN|nr:hypothetical protein [Romeria gracilis]MBE9079584.1 hypothetical protein [Romeria aff. gracilis LEGE 07310]
MTSSHPSNSSPPAGRSAGSEAANAGSYAPSVPMSVYRELAAELQATKAMVDSLSSQNHYLAQQNHLLKQEIHRAVQVTLTLGQFAGVTPQPADFVPEAPQPSANTAVHRTGSSPADNRPAPHPSAEPAPSGIRPLEQLSKLFTEQPEANRLNSESQEPKDMSSLWLILSITIIILTAFGAGFLIMRPLLSDR